jgi:hypothetical protein
MQAFMDQDYRPYWVKVATCPKYCSMAGHFLKYAKRVFGIPDFKYYASGDGLSNIFSNYRGRLIKPEEIHDSKLSFRFGQILGFV